MVQLFGDPFNLQGNSQNLQGGNVAPVLQPSASPTPQVAAPIMPRGAPAPATTPSYQAPKVSYGDLYYQNINGNQTVFNRKTGQGYSSKELLAADLGIAPNQIQWSNIAQPTQQTQPAQQTQLPTQYPTQQPTQQSTQQLTQQPQNQSLAQVAAQAGLSLDDYLKLVSGSVSPTERDSINASLGIPDLQNKLFQPAPSTQELYNNAYQSAGLGDLKAKIDAKLAEINALQQKYTDKAGTVNENPFLSEASRTGRLRVLDDKRLADIGNLQNEANSLASLYNNGINEVNAVVGRTTQDFSNNQQINSLKLQYLQQQAEQQLSDLKNSKTQAAYQYLPDYLKAKAAAQKPDTIGSNETGYYAWNPNTRTFEPVIPGKNDANEILSPTDAQLLGVPYGTTRGQAMSMGLVPAKPLTDSQNQAATYALRVSQAGTAIDSVINKIVNMNPIEYEAQKRLPSYLQSADFQAYEQAARNLINAVLRRESGAAIAQSEFDNAYAQYLPKPGDTTTTLDQKKQNREAILSGLIQSSGTGYNQLSGGSSNDPLGFFSSVGNTSASTMRTDRHNNPTAFTTDIAKLAGLKEGVDYTKGDPFSNGKYYTARLLGDPIATTIKVIDKIGFYTQSGNPRWTYVSSIPQAQNWNNLSYTQKKSVVAQMYQHEGGSALKQYFA